MQLMCRLYTADSQPARGRDDGLTHVEKLLRRCDEHGVRWAAMQIARLLGKLDLGQRSFSARAESFFQHGPARDLSELWTVKEIWESQVTALEALIQTSKSADTGPQDQSRRLGWRLSRTRGNDIEIVPVEQKRSKKGTWSKGARFLCIA